MIKYNLQVDDEISVTKTKKSKRQKPFYKKPKFLLLSIIMVFTLIICMKLYLKQSKNQNQLTNNQYYEKNPKRYTVLITDIGGTNARMMLLNMTKDLNIPPIVIDSKKLSSKDFQSIEELFTFYLKDFKDNYPLYAVIGIPGPIRNNTVLSLVNIPQWSMTNGDELGKKLGIKKVVLLNDFTCNSYGIQTNLKKDIDYIIINDVPRVKDGPMAVIGPGTGLGMGYLIKSNKDEYYSIGGSEGGHSDFAPKTEKTFRLKEFILKELKLKCVSIERCCAGPALIPMYKFLYKYHNKTVDRDPELGKLIDNFNDYSQHEDANDINKLIVSKGLSGKCKLSKEVLELFIEIYGDAAGNIAMFTIPTNGIYLVGGMTIALESMIKNTNIFMDHFINKDSYEYLVKSIPVYLIKNPNLGLIGAAECARRLLNDEN